VLVEHNIEYSLDLQRTFLSRSSHNFFSSWREYYSTFFWERTFWISNCPYRRRSSDYKAIRTQCRRPDNS
jgi:hypothetical protein